MPPHQSANNVNNPIWEGIGHMEVSKGKVSPMVVSSGGQTRLGARWRDLLGRMTTRTTVRGNIQPPIGQVCLIMTGIAGQDEGQMGVVTHHTRVMVGVTFRSKDGEKAITKLKHPRSLVLLEPDLVMVQESDGAVWIRSVERKSPDTYEG